VLQSITLQAPLLVIEVLSPTGIIGADRLEVSSRNRADPDLFPGRWDGQQFATLDLFCCETASGLVEIDESLSGATPCPSRISW